MPEDGVELVHGGAGDQDQEVEEEIQPQEERNQKIQGQKRWARWVVLSDAHNLKSKNLKAFVFQFFFYIIMIRYNSVWQANQELVGIHNDAAHKELVEIYNQLKSRKVN